ncbi:TonB-dependent siderophore receptor [Bordetella sp. N]|uniref:TonB-dependent siderophore receptor n=1 Tax=Bordetella sp. N TaxID=1746199 RepID=UPI0007102A13|nr:TonB-dependent siderophore receptor [Bordetella sp. N]ALM86108.1 ferric siderophore receptor [Bordetella sp. N]
MIPRSRALAAMAAATLVGTPACYAQAQTAVQDFDLPAAPLADTLAQLARSSGRMVSVDPALVAGRRTEAVRGRYSAEQALRLALGGTGLELVVTANGTLSLRPAPPQPQTTTLEPVSVVGAQESPTGHVDGYVARRGLSGMKTDSALIETPQSISVVTSDQIRDVKASSLADVLGYTPGFSSQTASFNRMVDDFMLRGFNVATGNSGMLRDGLKLQSSVYDGGQDPYGLERVEVLRGAASVLYGQLSPGGLVNAVSKRPTDTPLHELNVEGGSYDRRQLSGDFSGPLTEDGVWSYRVTGLTREANNWMDHTPDDKTYLAPSLRWQPSAATSLTMLATYQHIRTNFAAPLPAAQTLNGKLPHDFFVGEPDFDRYDTDTWTVGYAFEHAFNDSWKVRQSTRYFQADGNWDYLSFGALNANGSVRRGVVSRNERSTGVASDTSVEWKTATGPVAHTVLAGVDYYRSRYDSHRYSGTVTALDNIYDPTYGATPVLNTTGDYGIGTRGEALGLYLQDQMRLHDKWVLVLGERQDWARSNQTTFSSGANTRVKDSATSGRAGLVYLADNGLAPYVSASQSFSPTIGADRNGNPFKPTKGTQYELGMRYKPPGTEMLFSAAVYDLAQRNALTTDPDDSTYSVQTGKVRSRGLELEARAKFGAASLTASYAYTDARTTRSNDPTLVDQRVALVPLHAASLWADYDFTGLGIAGLTLGAGARYNSSSNIPGYDRDAPGYVLFDGMARYDFGANHPSMKGLSLTLNARNLFNRGYVSCAASNGCRYGAPRLLYATMTYRW